MKGLLTSIVLFALLIPMVASATADSTAPPAVVNKNSAERAALMSLYNSTDIIGWYENTGWRSDGSYCEWYGVNCDPSGHVQHLDLAGNRLMGPIPADIDALSAVQTLDLCRSLTRQA